MKIFPMTTKNRIPDPSEILALEFKGEFRRSAICSVSKTIDIGRSIFLGVLRKSGVSSLPKRPSAMVKSVAVSSVALAPVAIRRNIGGFEQRRFKRSQLGFRPDYG